MLKETGKRQITLTVSAGLFYKLKVFSKSYFRSVPSVINEALIYWIGQTKPFTVKGIEEFDTELDELLKKEQ